MKKFSTDTYVWCITDKKIIKDINTKDPEKLEHHSNIFGLLNRHWYLSIETFEQGNSRGGFGSNNNYSNGHYNPGNSNNNKKMVKKFILCFDYDSIYYDELESPQLISARMFYVCCLINFLTRRLATVEAETEAEGEATQCMFILIDSFILAQ